MSLRDVTDRINLLNQVRLFASRDGLTGALNRTEFLQCAACQLEVHRQDRNYPLSYIFLDLDNFKEINDTYGHPAGDHVLGVFAAEVQKQLRSTDIFGRTGGDEFAVIVPASIEEAYVLAERLRERITDLNIEVPAGPIQVMASLGLVSTAALSETDLELETLISLADQALYKAKQGGKNRVVAYRAVP